MTLTPLLFAAPPIPPQGRAAVAGMPLGTPRPALPNCAPRHRVVGAAATPVICAFTLLPGRTPRSVMPG